MDTSRKVMLDCFPLEIFNCAECPFAYFSDSGRFVCSELGKKVNKEFVIPKKGIRENCPFPVAKDHESV